MKIYISGKISGMNRFRSKLRFRNAQRYLENLGHEVVNPWTNENIQFMVKIGGGYTAILLNCIFELVQCDAIYMLDNYLESRGAKAEHAFAIACGIKVIYCKELYEKGTLRRTGTEEII